MRRLVPTRSALTAALSLALLAPESPAQILDLGSMGGPELGGSSYFEARAQELESVWSPPVASAPPGTLEADRALAERFLAHARWLAIRHLRSGDLDGAIGDYMPVVGEALARALPQLRTEADAFVDNARAIRSGGSAEAWADYERRRNALAGFVRSTERAFGTPDEPKPLGATLRAARAQLRSVVMHLGPLMTSDQAQFVGLVWEPATPLPTVTKTTESLSLSPSAANDAAALESLAALAAAERSEAHRAEAQRLASLIARAVRGARLVRTLGDEEWTASVQGALERACAGLDAPDERRRAAHTLERLASLGSIAEGVALLRTGRTPRDTETLSGIMEDFTRAVTAPGGPAVVTRDELLDAMQLVERSFVIASRRRALTEPQRMTGAMRRAWGLIQTEQAEREELMFTEVRRLAFSPQRITSPGVISSVAQARAGLALLEGLRSADDWLDELRDRGRLAVALGPRVSQRQRDLLVQRLRASIRDAADRDEREKALELIADLRERSRRLGKDGYEGTFAELGEQEGALVERMDAARAAWVEALIDEDDTARDRALEHLAILVRARDLRTKALFARKLNEENPRAFSRELWSTPAPFWSEAGVEAIADRAHAHAQAALRAALTDDPNDEEDDAVVRARLKSLEDEAAPAEALVRLTERDIVRAPTPADPLRELVQTLGFVPPADHPLERVRHDLASMQRWVYELGHAEALRSSGLSADILTHLSAVSADLVGRLED